MSLILCRQEPVKHPYYIDRLGIHIASSQELCYLIYNHPLLAMDDFVNDPLIQFIREELKQTFLAGKLDAWKKSSEDPDEMLIIILQECYYYSGKEIARFRQKLTAYRKMNRAEFMKETADYYFSLRQYGTAVHYYEKILEDWRIKSLTDEFTASIWNNIGASYAGIFWFEKAMTAYDMSYNFQKNTETLKKIYQLTLLNPELKLKDRYHSLLTEERKAEWKKELDQVMAEPAEGEKMSELTLLFDRDPIRRTKETGELLNRWKKEYRMML